MTSAIRVPESPVSVLPELPVPELDRSVRCAMGVTFDLHKLATVLKLAAARKGIDVDDSPSVLMAAQRLADASRYTTLTQLAACLVLASKLITEQECESPASMRCRMGHHDLIPGGHHDLIPEGHHDLMDAGVIPCHFVAWAIGTSARNIAAAELVVCKILNWRLYPVTGLELL